MLVPTSGRNNGSGQREMMSGVIQERVEVAQGAGGPRPRIAGHRIRVQDVVVWHEKLGLSPDKIVHQHPTLALADVYAALAYYWDHRDQIERAIADEQAFVQEFRKGYDTPLTGKLRRRRGLDPPSARRAHGERGSAGAAAPQHRRAHRGGSRITQRPRCRVPCACILSRSAPD